MARLEYVDPEVGTPEQRAMGTTIVESRGHILNLYRILLHSPNVAGGWLRHANAVRYESKLEGRVRELVICEVARLTRADYEWHHHQSIALREGNGPEQLESLPNWRGTGLFGQREEAALAYADAMTRHVDVDDPTFAAVRAEFDDQELLELTVTIAFYNLVARVLVALKIDVEAL